MTCCIINQWVGVKKSPARNVEANQLYYKNVLDALFPYFQKRESVKWILGNQCTNANYNQLVNIDGIELTNLRYW